MSPSSRIVVLLLLTAVLVSAQENSVAGGLVFYGDDSGAFVVLDAGTGKPLWNFHANVTWKASPMTYFLDGRQYVAVAAGSQVMAFALAEE